MGVICVNNLTAYHTLYHIYGVDVTNQTTPTINYPMTFKYLIALVTYLSIQVKRITYMKKSDYSCLNIIVPQITRKKRTQRKNNSAEETNLSIENNTTTSPDNINIGQTLLTLNMSIHKLEMLFFINIVQLFMVVKYFHFLIIVWMMFTLHG